MAPLDLTAALRARRDHILRTGSRTFAVLAPDGSRISVRDWDTAVFTASRYLAERGGVWEAQEFAWDSSITEPAFIVAKRRVFA